MKMEVDVMRTSQESAAAWFAHNAPIMRHYLEPGDSAFEKAFGPLAEAAARVEPIETPPRAWYDRLSFPPDLRFRRFVLGDSN